jgi:hypothetical protein
VEMDVGKRKAEYSIYKTTVLFSGPFILHIVAEETISRELTCH